MKERNSSRTVKYFTLYRTKAWASLSGQSLLATRKSLKIGWLSVPLENHIIRT
jgi:hypothetical protein